MTVLLAGSRASHAPKSPSAVEEPTEGEVILDGHIEINEGGLTLTLVGDDQCDAKPIECPQENGLTFDCSAYRAQLATLRKRFCDARGSYTWKGARLVRRRP